VQRLSAHIAAFPMTGTFLEILKVKPVTEYAK
jgi:hypothetical protein